MRNTPCSVLVPDNKIFSAKRFKPPHMGLSISRSRSIYGQDDVDYTSTTEIRLALEKYGITLSKKPQPYIPGKTKNGLYRAISESKISLPHDAIIGTRPWANGNWHWVLSCFLAISLFIISYTGLTVYLDMFRRRRKLGRKGLFWK